jgi:hypothetical protein
VLDELLEPLGVDASRRQFEDVTCPAPFRPAVPEHPPQLRDIDVQRLIRSRRRPPGPQVVDQPVGRHDLPALKQQDREQGALLRARDLPYPFLAGYLEGAEQAERETL